MNSDIRVSLDFFRHPKTKKLKKRLGADGVLSLQSLWVFAAQSRTDGCLEGMDKEDVELAADWCGDEGVFVDTLLAIGFLDDHEGIYSIHDWTVHNSYVATEEDRKDQSRFSRLAGVNRPAYQELKAKGINAITEEQYKELTRTKRPCVNDSLTTVGRPSDDRQTNVEANDNATSSPNQTKPNQDIESTNVDSCPEAQAQPDSSQSEIEDVVVFEMPVKAVKKGESNVFYIRQSHVNHFAELFPSLDIVQELKNMQAWNESRPAGSRKTSRGFIQHVTNWLIRSQNKIRPAARASPVNSQHPQQTEQPRPKEFDPTTIFGEDFRIDYAATEH